MRSLSREHTAQVQVAFSGTWLWVRPKLSGLYEGHLVFAILEIGEQGCLSQLGTDVYIPQLRASHWGDTYRETVPLTHVFLAKGIPGV